MPAPAAPSVRSALLLALSGFAILSVGDALVKTMAGQWPATAVATLRYTAGAAGLAAVVALREGRGGFAVPRPWLQLGRGAGVAIATICFFLGVMAMPLADATAVQFTSPILTALLAPLVLGERTRPATWVATLLAFAGVLVVLRPNLLALGPVALFPLGAAFGMSILVMLNRKAAGVASPIAMQFLAAMMATPILIAATVLLALTGDPQFHVPEPPLSVIVKCLTVAFTATIAHLLIYSATVRASAAVVAPMTYVQLLVAAALGWALFGSALDLSTLGGAALIVAGGLWLWRSQKPKEVPETE
ncbi:DMT family transporter [Sphingosinicella sp. CPCC 101087]|uniref:DMT family transporter n=1 Tax=Sphingosinicella sp. CPCC 101087 TaxID=2497754 RepID=UPI001FB0B9B3|nr:DMT family transporter [Sphingosinicella sp. CPCC 101087]